jgi:hypothetical protein
MRFGRTSRVKLASSRWTGAPRVAPQRRAVPSCCQSRLGPHFQCPSRGSPTPYQRNQARCPSARTDQTRASERGRLPASGSPGAGSRSSRTFSVHSSATWVRTLHTWPTPWHPTSQTDHSLRDCPDVGLRMEQSGHQATAFRLPAWRPQACSCRTFAWRLVLTRVRRQVFGSVTGIGGPVFGPHPHDRTHHLNRSHIQQPRHRYRGCLGCLSVHRIRRRRPTP